MSGIFRRVLRKTYPIGVSEPILCEREVTKTISENGISRTIIVVEKSDLSSVIMPEKSEFDLEEQLKAGYKPEEINVRGLIANEFGEFSAIEAFNSLQSQIDALNVKNDVETSKTE